MCETVVGTEAGAQPSESLCHPIVEAVADADGTSPTDLDPLYDAVDPDALDALVASLADDGSVGFSYHGYRITVFGDGRIDVSEP